MPLFLPKPEQSKETMKASGHCQQAIYISTPYLRNTKVFLEHFLSDLKKDLISVGLECSLGFEPWCHAIQATRICTFRWIQ